MKWEVSLESLDVFGTVFWQAARDAKVFAFHGEMGAGKTTTIAALCKRKGVKDSLSSPTFSIINEYGYSDANDSGTIYHIDLYRLEGEEEIRRAGVEDCVESGAYCFVEWPERAPWLFNEDAAHIIIKTISENGREVQLLTHAAFTAQSLEEQL